MYLQQIKYIRTFQSFWFTLYTLYKYLFVMYRPLQMSKIFIMWFSKSLRNALRFQHIKFHPNKNSHLSFICFKERKLIYPHTTLKIHSNNNFRNCKTWNYDKIIFFLLFFIESHCFFKDLLSSVFKIIDFATKLAFECFELLLKFSHINDALHNFSIFLSHRADTFLHLK